MRNTFVINLERSLLKVWKLICRHGKPEAGIKYDLPLLSIEDFKPAVHEEYQGKALIVLSPTAYLRAKQNHPNIKLFNFDGLSYTLVKVLNEAALKVDIVDLRSPSFPADDYDLVIAHGGPIGGIIDSIPSTTPVLQYVAGLYWKEFNRQTRERYARFEKRFGVAESIVPARHNNGQEENMDRLLLRSDVCFTADLPRLVSLFGRYGSKFRAVGLGAYVDEEFALACSRSKPRDRRDKFIYVAGTRGNIQKGLDVIVEAFSHVPNADLFIYCQVEEEVSNHAADLLNLPNVHYIYHWRFKPFRSRLTKILQSCDFTIHAPIDTGVGTAFMGAVGAGLIPVGYFDASEDFEGAVLARSWQPLDLAESIRAASALSIAERAHYSEQARRSYQKHASPEAVEQGLSGLVTEVLNRK